MDTSAIKKPKEFVREFLDEYLGDGLGAKSKREIDILVMDLLMRYGGLGARSNQELSILLQAPVSRIKSLRYEARLKYPPDEDYVRREFLYILSRSKYAIETGRIVFAIEDNYIRHAIQGQLKARGMFADTSFNSELIKIDRRSLAAVIGELYDAETAQAFQDGFDEMESQGGEDADFAGEFSTFMFDLVKAAAQKFALDLALGRLGFQ
ncbi:MAG: hypothetical protein QY332_15220 [Anaerolineales bacterium]|nr:MAG: hypothetical protein QY332_15220 [Anaerolineales bacterium]